MKKTFKIILIGLLSLFVVCLIVAGIFSWVIFKPEKLTPIVRNQLDKMLICEHQTGNVELTFFSTFPEFGIQINGLLLKNALSGTPSDTLFSTDKIIATVDFKALWKNRELIVNKVFVENPFILAFTDSTGRTNYDIFKSDSDEKQDTSVFKLPFQKLLLEKVQLENGRIIYHDDAMGMILSLNRLNTDIHLLWKEEVISGNMQVNTNSFSFSWKNTDYIKNLPLELNLPIFTFNLDNKKLSLDKSNITLNKLYFDLKALVQNKPDEMLLDIAFNSTELPIKSVFDLMRVPFETYLKGMTVDGTTYLNGTLKGIVKDSILPEFNLNANFNDIEFAYESLAYKLFDLSGKTDIVMDLNDEDKWYVKVYDLNGKTGKSSFSGSALIDQLLGDMRFDIEAKTRLNLLDAKPMLPDDKPINMSGLAIADAKVKFLYSQFQKNQFDRMNISGKFALKDLAVDYDTISLRSNAADLAFRMPNIKSKQTSFIELDIASQHLKVQMGQGTRAVLKDLDMQLSTSNMMSDSRIFAAQGNFKGKNITAAMDNLSTFLNAPKGNFSLSMDMQDTTSIPVFDCRFDIQQLAASMDTIQIDILNPKGTMSYRPDISDLKRPYMDLQYNSNQLAARMGDTKIDTKNIYVDASVAYDKTQENFLLQWIPKGHVKLQEGKIKTPQLTTEIHIPTIDFDFTPDEYLIRDSRLVIDKSDFQLTGKLTNVRPYLKDEDLLKGDFNFRSQTTDVNQLLKMVNGFGTEEDIPDKQQADVENEGMGPFMVPKGVDISLYSSINEAFISKDTARNVQGTIKVKDGVMVLESMLFTTSAAKMQLTGMYKSPRRNHLFTGIDLHLLEIEIPELLKLIPDVDTIMPMLRSFAGTGEFHLVIETYLDSAYNLKKSTLLGSASVRGKDLVLLDGETFSEIAKKLYFNKKTENKIDSISAEFTVIKNNVYVYPFLIVMDKYKAIIEGRHNIDMNFDYHISLIDSPLPLRIGVDVKGNLDKMKVLPVKCKYANMYRPAKRTELDTKKLELRNMIRKELMDKIREE